MLQNVCRNRYLKKEVINYINSFEIIGCMPYSIHTAAEIKITDEIVKIYLWQNRGHCVLSDYHFFDSIPFEKFETKFFIQ